MQTNHLPLKNPKPNGAEFIDIILGRVKQTRTPLVEYIVDEMVMRPVVEKVLEREWVEPVDNESRDAFYDNFIAFWHQMGYDHVRCEHGLPFQENSVIGDDPAPGSHKKRGWKDHKHGSITSWDEFEQYPWPKVEEMDFSAMEYIDGHLPEGMGFISCHGGGIFEHVSGIMSLEGLCMALLEQPDLVQAVVDRVGELLLAYHRQLLDLENVIAIFQGDDMGFKTQTLIGPDHMRQYFLAWHKRFAAQAHEHGRPYFLHSCGNLESIMEAVIDDVGIDAKHSYEDVIIPVEDFQARYGDRIGVLGGIDLNILSGGTPDDVRRRTRELIEVCGARGRYAIGSGNSVPSYVPVENYLAMIDEAVGMM
jgi:uroporphyrinogen decarboxylase